jgi:hypothetical protein
MPVYARGIDYAWQHPNMQAIKDAGYDYIIRYYSRDPSKNLTRAEADSAAKVGLWVVGNWEHTANDALGGHSAGVANARLARSLADACRQPLTRPIYESDDFDVTPEQEAIVTEYLRGWDSVIGVAEVGEYAGFYPLRAQRDAGVTSWEWQPRAWSGGQWEPRVNIRQVGTAIVGGVEVDVNEAWTADYGQWRPNVDPFAPIPAPITSKEIDMARLFDVQADPANAANAPGIWAAVEGVGYFHVTDTTELPTYRAGGTPEGPVSYAQHLTMLAASAKITLSDAQVATLGAAIAAGLPTHITGTQTTTVSETLD